MADTILVVNAGSSSIKFCVYHIGATSDLSLTLKGQVSGVGTRPSLRASDAGGRPLVDETFSATEIPDVAVAMGRVGAWLREHLAGEVPVAIGHRVAHGGPTYRAPVSVDNDTLAALERLVPLAPMHQPYNLRPIRTIQERFPSTVQVACFDTGFHQGHPDVADRFAIPETLYQEGVRRYGFHGLSYEYIARALPRVAPEIAQGSVVVAHLGSGASMCAIKGGRSMDSTMAFTGLDGLPMGTRCGQIDPGVLLYLVSEKGYGAKELERFLYHETGLHGLSGISNDVRDLLASDDQRARLALDYFVYRVERELGALAAAMQGLDGVVLTAGISENSPEMRARICRGAAWLGLKLDEAANRAGGPRISTRDSKVSAWVIPTDEERMIAEHTLKVWREQ
ncbi:MAG: acetate/propionate family kinase [Nitrospira sp. LK70]|nr:acetate/propionate family kinase [Nitrospira sp. LK70]